MSASAALCVVLGYLSGSVPFGVLLALGVAGEDVRTQGSGNIGATNVARVVGKKWGLVVLVLDASKGALPVLATLVRFPDHPWLQAVAGLAAVLGHVFPVWLKFRGGKGVATSLGALAVLAPAAAGLGALAFVFVFAIFRLSSLGSLIGALVAVASMWAMRGPRAHAGLGTVLLLLLVWTHRSNLARLWRRQETRL